MTIQTEILDAARQSTVSGKNIRILQDEGGFQGPGDRFREEICGAVSERRPLATASQDSSTQRDLTFSACQPLGPLVTSNSTAWPSCRLRKPPAWMAAKCTKTSSPF